MTEAPATLADAERAALLDAAIGRETMAGATLLSRAGFEAVMDPGIKTKHATHAIFAIWTAGVGLIPWYRAATRSTPRYTVTVDQWGRTWSRDADETNWLPLD